MADSLEKTLKLGNTEGRRSGRQMMTWLDGIADSMDDTELLGFLSILKNCQASSTFEAVNFTWLSSCQRHVRPLFEMKWRPRAFCSGSTGDSDILSSGDKNDEHA